MFFFKLMQSFGWLLYRPFQSKDHTTPPQTGFCPKFGGVWSLLKCGCGVSLHWKGKKTGTCIATTPLTPPSKQNFASGWEWGGLWRVVVGGLCSKNVCISTPRHSYTTLPPSAWNDNSKKISHWNLWIVHTCLDDVTATAKSSLNFVIIS